MTPSGGGGGSSDALHYTVHQVTTQQLLKAVQALDTRVWQQGQQLQQEAANAAATAEGAVAATAAMQQSGGEPADLGQEASRRNAYLLAAVAAAAPVAAGSSSVGDGGGNTSTDGADAMNRSSNTATSSSSTPTIASSNSTGSGSTGSGRGSGTGSQQVLGYLLCGASSLVLHISRLVVAPEARRQGVGAALLRAALHDVARARRVQAASLYVAASNVPAVALYRKAGFRQDALIPDYFTAASGPGRAAIRMQLQLQGDEEEEKLAGGEASVGRSAEALRAFLAAAVPSCGAPPSDTEAAPPLQLLANPLGSGVGSSGSKGQ